MNPLFLRASFWEMILWLQGAPILLHFQGFHSHDPTDPVARLHDHSVSRCRKSAPYKYCLRGFIENLLEDAVEHVQLVYRAGMYDTQQQQGEMSLAPDLTKHQ